MTLNKYNVLSKKMVSSTILYKVFYYIINSLF